MIKLENITQEFSNGRGIFDVSFNINKGEVFGFLGPNGSGKTITMRHLLGFMKPQKGHSFIHERNAFAVAGGLTFVFYLIDMVGKIVIKVDWIRHLSLFSLYESGKIAKGDTNKWFSSIIFIVIGITGYTLAILIFRKRNLSL